MLERSVVRNTAAIGRTGGKSKVSGEIPGSLPGAIGVCRVGCFRHAVTRDGDQPTAAWIRGKTRDTYFCGSGNARWILIQVVQRLESLSAGQTRRRIGAGPTGKVAL